MTGVVRSRLAVAAVLMAALVACLAVLQSQRSHPRAFDEAGGWGFRGPSKVGETKYVGMSYDRRGVHGTATIHDVTALLDENTSAARIRYYVCRLGGAKTIAAIGIVGRDRLAGDCLSLQPVSETDVRLGRMPMDQIVMAVTPTKPGRVVIRGLRVTYTQGWKTGTQTIGGHITFRTS